MSTDITVAERGASSITGPSRSNFLQEWFILLLGAISAGLLGAVVGSYAIDTDPAAMAMLATAGYLIGYLLARTLVPDIVAHGMMFLMGIAVALFTIEPNSLWEQIRAGEWRLDPGSIRDVATRIHLVD